MDFEAKVKVEDHNNALEFLLADDHVQTLREPQDGDHGPGEASAEISKSMYVVKLLGKLLVAPCFSGTKLG